MKQFFLAIIIVGSVQICKAADVVISGPTTISQLCTMVGSTSPIADLTGRTLRFQSGASITGTGTIKNGSVDANFYQNIFDLNLTLTNMTACRRYFSACWFGAIGSGGIDNAASLQRAINVCIAQTIPVTLFIPPGNYDFASSLRIAIDIGPNAYKPVSFHMFGGSQFWNGPTTLNYTGVGDTYALAIQDGWGVEVNNLIITGKYNPPAFSLNPSSNYSTYFFTQMANYQDKFGLCFDKYSGIVIDPGSSVKGSIGVKIHDMIISNFAVDISVSPGNSAHSDMLTFENIHVRYSKWGIQSGFSGSKGNIVRGLYSWESMHTLISIGKSGRNEAGSWTFDGANIAGCIRIFDIMDAGWYPIRIKDFYSESIGSVGSIIVTPPVGTSQSASGYTEPPVYVEGCNFHLLEPIPPYSSQDETQVALNVSIGKVRFESCAFRYYSTSIPGKTIFITTDDPALTFTYADGVYTSDPAQNAAFNNCTFQGYVWLNHLTTTSTTATIPPSCTNTFPQGASCNPTIFLMN